MGLITETNYQYYEGSQLFISTGAAGQILQCTFDSQLEDHERPPNIQTQIALGSGGNGFVVGDILNVNNQIACTTCAGAGLTIEITGVGGNGGIANVGQDGYDGWAIISEGAAYQIGDLLFVQNPDPNSANATFTVSEIPTSSNANYVIEIRGANDNDYVLYQGNYYLSSSNQITIPAPIAADTSIRVRFIDPAKWNNYGSYEYVPLSEIINNFMNIYIGSGNLIPQARRSDVIFHAKRGLQEFSYDTLKSVKSQELTIPHNLSVIIPQDYVNYVSFFRIDSMGVQRPIYPANLLHQSPYTSPIQDGEGVPVQDDKSKNLEGTSIADGRWKNLEDYKISGAYSDQMYNEGVYDWGWEKIAYGQRYGLTPETSQNNGWFNINNREGKIMFSSNLVNQVIIFHYISDGLAYDADMKIPKLAEEALYMHIAYGILSSRMNVPEYVVRRYKTERRAALRNAKIRLSNIKLGEIIQVMRNKSKWIKH